MRMRERETEEKAVDQGFCDRRRYVEHGEGICNV